MRYPDGMGRAAVGVLLIVATLAMAPPAALAQQAPTGPSKTLTFRFPAGTSLRSALTFISESSGIGVNFESTFADSKTNSVIDLQDVTFEEALATVLPTNGLYYKVLGAAAVMVIPDTPQNRQKYEDTLIRTFPLSGADATELAALLTGILAAPSPGQTRPQIQANKGANTVTIRGGASTVALAERIVAANDKPRMEIRVDLEFLEVDRSHAKSYGLNLSTFVVGVQYAPGTSRSAATSAGTQIDVPTLLSGLSPTDFQVTVPSVVIKFLETDSRTRILAKPSLRGAEGSLLSISLGEEVPVPTTTFQAVGTAAVGAGPIASFTYRTVGLSVSATPRVTATDDVLLDMEFEASTQGPDATVGGQTLPSFLSRKAKAHLRLHDGESSLLAGVIYDDGRDGIGGIVGGIRVPIIRQLFSGNDSSSTRKEVLVLVTPHVLRPREITVADLRPNIIRVP